MNPKTFFMDFLSASFDFTPMKDNQTNQGETQ
jgi:hypothetical protein